MQATVRSSVFVIFSWCVCAGLVAVPAAAAPGAYSAGVTVTPLLKTEADGAGRKLVYPTAGAAEVTAVLVEIPPGGQTNWHRHPVPCFAYMLEGELLVELAGGEARTLKAGQAFAEVIDVLHNGVNRTDKPVRLVMFVIGTAGQAYAMRPPSPTDAPTPTAKGK